MEIFKSLSTPASKEFEKLLNSQLSKINIEATEENKSYKTIIICGKKANFFACIGAAGAGFNFC